MFSDLKFKTLPVPGLQVGDRLEYEIVYSVHSPVKRGDFWSTYSPTRAVEVSSERVTLDLPGGSGARGDY